MKQIQLKIEALSPLSIGRRKPGGSISEAETYIPGSVIRGAIAGQILQQANINPGTDLSSEGGDFAKLFLSEESAIFRNAYPGDQDIDSEIRVLPATALSSKTSDGFKPGRNGVFDTLIDRYWASVVDFPYDPDCPTDGGRVGPFRGFYRREKKKDEEDNYKYESCSAERRLLTRVGINRRRATAEDQILYSLQVLSETNGKEKHPSLFIGSILLSDQDLAGHLVNFLNQSSLRLGGGGSRGLGRVAVTAETRDLESGASDRIDTFNQKLTERWADWCIFRPGSSPQEYPGKGTHGWFTLDLQSDAILQEDWRRTTVISTRMLKQHCGIEDDDSLELKLAYSSYDYRSGWNSAWGLMKDIELVTNIGSVYLFSTTRLDDWRSRLVELEKRGVGDRRTEGFGQIRICDEFHQVLREERV